MWSTMWEVLVPLTGVMIGGAITWVTQSRMARRQERIASAQFLRERQQAAYAEFLASTLRSGLQVARFMATDSDLRFKDMQDSVLDSELTLATLKLLAPADTARAAQELAEATYLAEGGETEAARDAMAARAQAARVQFFTLARRDIDAGELAT